MASYLDQTGLAHFKEKFTAANDAKYALKGESAGIATADKADAALAAAKTYADTKVADAAPTAITNEEIDAMFA